MDRKSDLEFKGKKYGYDSPVWKKGSRVTDDIVESKLFGMGLGKGRHAPTIKQSAFSEKEFMKVDHKFGLPKNTALKNIFTQAKSVYYPRCHNGKKSGNITQTSLHHKIPFGLKF